MVDCIDAPVPHTVACVLSAAECCQDMWVFMCGVHVLRTVVRATVMQSVAMLHVESLYGVVVLQSLTRIQ